MSRIRKMNPINFPLQSISETRALMSKLASAFRCSSLFFLLLLQYKLAGAQANYHGAATGSCRLTWAGLLGALLG